MPSARATVAATASRWPASAACSSVNSAADAMWARVTITMWVGARGAMSWNATTRSSACTCVDGISPAAIAQNRQSFSTGRTPTGSPEHGLGAHKPPDRADEAGHGVRHVALAPGQRYVSYAMAG